MLSMEVLPEGDRNALKTGNSKVRIKRPDKHLLECAGREFLEKGYMKASLRNICKEAGVTTGALYFFFKDKEDLLAALVEETAETTLC